MCNYIIIINAVGGGKQLHSGVGCKGAKVRIKSIRSGYFQTFTLIKMLCCTLQKINLLSTNLNGTGIIVNVFITEIIVHIIITGVRIVCGFADF